MNKLPTAKVNKRSPEVKQAIKTMESQSQIAGIKEYIGDAKMGAYVFRDQYTGELRAGSSDNLPKRLMNHGIDETNINTVHVMPTRSYKQMVKQDIEVNAIASEDDRFSNVNKGHGGLKRPVLIINKATDEKTVVSSAYDAAKVVGTTRMNVYNKLVRKNKIVEGDQGTFAVRYRW